jgi:2-desacetyl-2-hydroxyethyl bacteriochlorophyllide A dehydrogenase
MNKPQTMLAGAYFGAGNIQAVHKPVPQPEAGEVIVKVIYAGICGTDMHTYQSGGHTPEGMTIGHEFSGHVVAIGTGVKGIAIGQRVTANPMCDYIGLGIDGAFAEYLKIPNAQLGVNVFELPATVDYLQGALVEPLAVALHGIEQCQLGSDTHVVIQGLGTIGLCALLIAKQRGVKKLVAIDQAGCRLQLAQALGFKTIALGDDKVEQTLADYFGTANGLVPSPNVNLVIDATGNEAALSSAINRLAPQGQLLILGTYVAPVTLDMTLLVAKEIHLIGSLAYGTEFAQALDLIASGAIDVSPLVTHQMALTDIEQAFIQQGKVDEAIKVILTIQPSAE